jgi:hypothetical protein
MSQNHQIIFGALKKNLKFIEETQASFYSQAEKKRHKFPLKNFEKNDPKITGNPPLRKN